MVRIFAVYLLTLHFLCARLQSNVEPAAYLLTREILLCQDCAALYSRCPHTCSVFGHRVVYPTAHTPTVLQGLAGD